MESEMKKFALHVISGADFGVSFSWEETSEDLWPNHTLTFRESLDELLKNIFLNALIPRPLLYFPIQILQNARVAYTEFGGYLRDLLARERQWGSKTDRQNLMSVLVKNAATTKGDDDIQGSLQDQDIIGNAFLFLMAGHDTTYSYPHPRQRC